MVTCLDDAAVPTLRAGRAALESIVKFINRKEKRAKVDFKSLSGA